MLYRLVKNTVIFTLDRMASRDLRELYNQRLRRWFAQHGAERKFHSVRDLTYRFLAWVFFGVIGVFMAMRVLWKTVLRQVVNMFRRKVNTRHDGVPMKREDSEVDSNASARE